MEAVVAIIGVGVTLLLAILGVWRDIKGELKDVRNELHNLAERVAHM
jgi:hypothetical protein